MSLSESEVRRIAWLARLELTDAEVDCFREELSAILKHLQVLEKVDSGITQVPGSASPLHNVLREDVPAESLSCADVLANAPETEDSYLRVPPILE